MNERAAKSLVLVTVDCWRADHAGFMGYPAPTTPFLDRLAAESLVFPKAIVTGAPTYYSFPGLLAARFPLGLGREVVGLAPGELTLATVFERAGYETAAYVAANPYLSARFGYQQGFAVFRDFLVEESARSGERQHAAQTPRVRTRFNQRLAKLAHGLGPVGAWYDELYFQYCQRIAAPKNQNWDGLRRFPSADVLVNEACAWLASLGSRPFFLWLHLMDPHAPYYPPAQAIEAMGTGRVQPARGRYLNGSWNRGDLGPGRLRNYRDEIVGLYDAGIRWVDMQLARLVEALRASSRWDSCVFALTADHGEEFLDHGGRFHLPSRAYQEMLHVPLLLRMPGVGKKLLSDAPFSHLHLAPTILDAVGIEPSPEFEGRSYWPQVLAGAGWELAVSESVGRCTNPMAPEKRLGSRVLAVQDRRHKLILDFERHTEELFDLDVDPGEQRVLPTDAEKTIRVRLLRTALQHLERGSREPKAALALAARVRQIGLEWSHSEMPSETPAT
ncbi:MAG: sulfatase-like hydrolase/transferase [Terriglobales bacterium]